MKNVILIRGIPGSGKSTLYEKNFKNTHMLLEADQYFMVGDKYCFDASKLKDAHGWCQWKFDQCIYNDIPVVVANTFTKRWEMQYYLDRAEDASVIRMETQYGNIHGVPDNVVQQMKSRFENYSGEIYVR